MPKNPECNRCLNNARSEYLVCADHPTGSENNFCPDFTSDPNAEPEEVWEPEGASYYNSELILQPKQRWTPEEKLERLDYHPMFTGRCPSCEMPFDMKNKPPVHWDCPHCEWVDDSV